MRTIESITEELDAVNAESIPLLQRSEQLREELRLAKSLRWIEANEVKIDQVQLPGDCVTWDQFCELLERMPDRKRYAEWNGAIYHTDELLANRAEPTPGRLTEVPGYQP